MIVTYLCYYKKKQGGKVMDNIKTADTKAEIAEEKDDDIEKLLAMVEEIAMVRCLKCDVN